MRAAGRLLVALALVLVAASAASAADKPVRMRGKLNHMRLTSDAHASNDVYYFSTAVPGSLTVNTAANGMQFNWITFQHLGTAGTHIVRLYGPGSPIYDGWSDAYTGDYVEVYVEAASTVTIEGSVWYGLCVTSKAATNFLIYAGWDRRLER